MLFAGAALAVFPLAASAQDKELTSVGLTVGSLGNPFFVAMQKGAADKLKEINPDANLIAASADYDLNKQFTQIDNFIASGVQIILLNAADPQAILPAVKRAQDAGITVVAVDVAAAGADATVMTDNVKAGEIACQYLAEKIGDKGNVIIENGPQVSSVIDRVKGCEEALSKSGDIKVLSKDQNAQGSRDGGLNVMQGYLTRYDDIAGVFAINDPQAVGSDLAAKQLNRSGIVITSVDGAPDIEQALKSDTLIQASASQDPYKMAQTALETGYKLMNGEKVDETTILIPPELITRDNVDEYKGWTSK
ncbi:MAG: ABC transporter substrate-binding protein [Geminicoccaceae bacterium]|nr:ABC transporter substrate-binding protein [Geminicoccaceae bacterium]